MENGRSLQRWLSFLPAVVAMFALLPVPAHAAAIPPRPPESITATDHPWDDGTKIDVAFSLSPDDGSHEHPPKVARLRRGEIGRAERPVRAGRVTARPGYAGLPQTIADNDDRQMPSAASRIISASTRSLPTGRGPPPSRRPRRPMATRAMVRRRSDVARDHSGGPCAVRSSSSLPALAAGIR